MQDSSMMDDSSKDGATTDNTEVGDKVPSDLQSKVTDLLQGATLPELDFIIDEATILKKKMMKSQNKSHLSTDSFSTEDMPS
jgi:hypothetical protein